jgi:hypothetical protein
VEQPGGGTGAGPRAAGADGHGAERVSAVRFVFLEGRITAIINPEKLKNNYDQQLPVHCYIFSIRKNGS